MEWRRETEPHGAITLWSLRPAGEHAGLRRAAQATGFRLRVLPQLRLSGRPSPAALAAALQAPLRIHTSPAAARFAARAAGGLPEDGIDLAVGSGTAATLRALGARDVRSPQRMDSEGLLEQAELQAIAGRDIGLLTAPGGRGLLQPALEARAARVLRAEVYARLPLHGGARRRAAFVADHAGVLLVTSAEALQRALAGWPGVDTAAGRRLRARGAVAGSARLAARLREAGFLNVVEAAGPTPEALVDAARIAASYTSRAASGRAPLVEC